MVSAKVESQGAGQRFVAQGLQCAGRMGEQRLDAECQQEYAADEPEPILVSEQPGAHIGEAESGHRAEDGVRQRRAEPRDQAETRPSNRQRRTHSTPTGPTGSAMTRPTAIPFSSVISSMGFDRSVRDATGLAQPPRCGLECGGVRATLKPRRAHDR